MLAMPIAEPFEFPDGFFEESTVASFETPSLVMASAGAEPVRRGPRIPPLFKRVPTTDTLTGSECSTIFDGSSTDKELEDADVADLLHVGMCEPIENFGDRSRFVGFPAGSDVLDAFAGIELDDTEVKEFEERVLRGWDDLEGDDLDTCAPQPPGSNEDAPKDDVLPAGVDEGATPCGSQITYAPKAGDGVASSCRKPPQGEGSSCSPQPSCPTPPNDPKPSRSFARNRHGLATCEPGRPIAADTRQTLGGTKSATSATDQAISPPRDIAASEGNIPRGSASSAAKALRSTERCGGCALQVGAANLCEHVPTVPVGPKKPVPGRSRLSVVTKVDHTSSAFDNTNKSHLAV
mmetsp:Transcript_36034/g.90585  ORF Transcript_36034/g.90585 Transcript_36034/m.90585 type:complete len:350 (-) Transcript_36034:193-1242(-)